MIQYKYNFHFFQLQQQAELFEIAHSILIEISKSAVSKWQEKLKTKYGWFKNGDCKHIIFDVRYNFIWKQLTHAYFKQFNVNPHNIMLSSFYSILSDPSHHDVKSWNSSYFTDCIYYQHFILDLRIILDMIISGSLQAVHGKR